jgi:hypothetical protein
MGKVAWGKTPECRQNNASGPSTERVGDGDDSRYHR